MSKNFSFNLIKARVAETLIKQLFVACEYHVFDHGMEHAMPTITGRLNTNNSPEAKQIRQMPDFVVQNPTNGQLVYLEVKYRASGEFKRKDLDKSFHYNNAIFIFVTQNGIYCISFNELEYHGKLPLSKEFRLINSKHFNLDQSKIERFESFSKQLFAGVK